MKFSEAVLIREENGKLVVELPRRAAAALNASAGDVLCWTGLDDGSVEVWRVAKNPYRRLEVEGASHD
ncbi:MAG: hypothetical protein IRZ14_03830 [Chloroflexi bacterium]|nr:hypothetical protein [Chloroflexota bacterium]